MDVLIVDDEPVSRLAAAQVMQSAGFGVVVASNGEEALKRLTDESLQLVVCDWSMPGMNGLELCRAIRSNRLRRYVYVLMLTSHNRSEDIIQGLQAGADDYLTKPFSPAELVLRVTTGRRLICSESSNLMIFALAKLAESRDPDTGAHLERVRSYCRLLANELRHHAIFPSEIDDAFVRLIFETSPLHDIGKVAIPDSILLKPGKLTAEEFTIMKTHTTQGAKTLAAAMGEFPNADFLRMAHDIALCHHERFNGSGYPLGLSGDAIPLCGRIVALADVYDALTSKRVYKSACSHEEAVDAIVAEKGEHFDPVIVEMFLKVQNEFRELSEHVADVRHNLPLIPATTSDSETSVTEIRGSSSTNFIATPRTVTEDTIHDLAHLYGAGSR